MSWIKPLPVSSIAILVLLAGCGKDTVDVSGQVAAFQQGGPVPGARVKVADKAIVTSAADGTFSVSSVSVPYDVSAVSADGTIAVVLVGLSRKDPIIALPLSGPSQPARSATVSGRILDPQGAPPQHTVLTAIEGRQRAGARIDSSTLDPAGSYTATVKWLGDATLAASLKAVELVQTKGIAQSFDAAGTLSISLSDGKTSSGADLKLSAVTNARLTGTITTPPGFTLNNHILFAALGPTTLFALGTSPPNGTVNPVFDYPGISSAAVALGVQALAGRSGGSSVFAWTTGLPSAGGVRLAVPAPPVIQPPSQISPGEKFSWTPVEGAVYRFTLFATGLQASQLVVYTSATTFAVPDLSASGFVWPKSTVYATSTLALTPRSTDDVAAGDELPPQDHDGARAASESIQVVTAP